MPPLSFTVSVADRAPFAVGVKVTLTVQLKLAARVVPQLLFWVKSPGFVPDTETLIPVIEVPLPLVSVNTCGKLELPTPMLAKLKLAGVSDTFKVPVPVKLTVCVPTASMMVTVPVRVPTAVGVKVTLIVQLEFPASDEPQLSVSAKSPEAVMLVMLTLFELVLLRVTAWEELVVPTS